MNAAVVWIILPLIISFALLVLRRNYRLSSWLQAGVCFTLALIGIFSTTDPTTITGIQKIVLDPIFSILGRSLVIDSNLRNLIIILFIFLGSWTLALTIFKVRSRVVPLGLPFLAFVISALAVEPFLYSALLIEMAVIVGVLMVADTNADSKKGVLRYLIYFSFGVPFVLLAGWYLAGGEITPVNEEQLVQATLLLGLGFVFWLGVFPFQSWIPLIAEENRPTESFLLLIIMPVAIVMLLLKYLNGFVWLREYEAVFQGLRIFGLIMVITGSGWAFFQKQINRMASYLMIASTGAMLLSIGLNLSAGIYISSYLVFVRLITFFVLTWSLFILQRETGKLTSDSLRSLFYSSPFLGFSIIIALFTSAGMPLLPGFPVMQGLYAYLSAVNQWVNISVILSMGIISILFIRLSFLVFRKKGAEIRGLISLNKPETVFFIILILFITAAGLFPDPFLSGFEGTVNGFEFLVK